MALKNITVICNSSGVSYPTVQVPYHDQLKLVWTLVQPCVCVCQTSTLREAIRHKPGMLARTQLDDSKSRVDIIAEMSN